VKAGLRIGLVCPYSFEVYGGVQNHVLGLARYLREEGHDPHILAPGCPEPALTDGLRFTSAGPAVPVPYNGSVARVNFGPRTATRVRRWLRSTAFDVLHLHEPVTPSAALLALWLAASPVVATYHTATPRSRTMEVAGTALQGWIAKIDAGLAVSETARQVVARHLGRDAVVIPNGVRAAEFEHRSTPRLAWRGGARPRVTFLGRLDERRKGLDVLIAALPALRAAVPEVDVVVAGRGSRALPAGVRSLGAVSNADKQALLASTDVFVAPHRERESFGLVLVEALASGADVVASDLPAFHELLRHDGVSLGRLVPVGDPDALASAVADRIAGRAPSAQPAAAAAVRCYDWSVVGAAITGVYRAVLRGAPLQPAPQPELL
jgi:phosphatidyl-myo-inositol alpha-mannosyltransferase